MVLAILQVGLLQLSLLEQPPILTVKVETVLHWEALKLLYV
jgi:DUF1365 family protein